jgi:thioredoxin 2
MSRLTLDARGVLTACPSCGTTNRLRYEALDRTTRCARCHTTLPAPAYPVEVPAAGVFDELVARAPIPLVVDFWAPWCGPCRAVAPELQKVARSMAGGALVVKVNTDEQAELADRFRIRSIPTLAVFRDGRETTRVAGARSAADIEALVARHAHA